MGFKLKDKNFLLILILLGILYLAYSFLSKNSGSTSSVYIPDQLNVHFIDVGQGDATLLKGPDFTILVDAGSHDQDDVLPYLKSQKINEIDLLIGTHPHADHIGQFPQVLEYYQVHEVWLSGDLHTTQTFERALDAIEKTDAKYKEPRANETYSFGSAQVQIIHPKNVTGELNNGSIVFKLHYHEMIFLFTGDAEFEAEHEILERGHDLKSHILKIGHHGSNTSTSELFLKQIDPKVAIYSAAKGNSYGHPHQKVIERLLIAGVDIYGTDIDGTIVLTTDGKTYEIEVSKNEELSKLVKNSIDKSCI